MKNTKTSTVTSIPKLKFYNSVESSNNKSLLSVGMAGRCSSSTCYCKTKLSASLILALYRGLFQLPTQSVNI